MWGSHTNQSNATLQATARAPAGDKEQAKKRQGRSNSLMGEERTYGNGGWKSENQNAQFLQEQGHPLCPSHVLPPSHGASTKLNNQSMRLIIATRVLSALLLNLASEVALVPEPRARDVPPPETNARHERKAGGMEGQCSWAQEGETSGWYSYAIQDDSSSISIPPFTLPYHPPSVAESLSQLLSP